MHEREVLKDVRPRHTTAVEGGIAYEEARAARFECIKMDTIGGFRRQRGWLWDD